MDTRWHRCLLIGTECWLQQIHGRTGRFLTNGIELTCSDSCLRLIFLIIYYMLWISLGDDLENFLRSFCFSNVLLHQLFLMLFYRNWSWRIVWKLFVHNFDAIWINLWSLNSYQMLLLDMRISLSISLILEFIQITNWHFSSMSQNYFGRRSILFDQSCLFRLDQCLRKPFCPINLIYFFERFSQNGCIASLFIMQFLYRLIHF